MKKYLATILLAMLAHVSVCAAQNPGNFQPGFVYGNNSATVKPPSAASLTSMFDRAFCSTNNAVNVRISGTWVCLTSANNAVWATSGSGVPALTQTLPNAVQDNITRLGTVVSGSLHIATVTNLAAPTLASDAATKDYVDSTAAGRVFHPAALVATATGVVLPNTPTYNNGASGVGATLTAGANAALVVDGTTVSVVGTTVLVKDQASTLQNGEYTLTTAGVAGGGGNPWVLTRDTSMDAPAEMVAGETVFVQSGSTNTNTSWTLSAAVTTVGTSPVTFVNTGGAGNNTWGISGTNIFNNNAGEVRVTNGVLNGTIGSTTPATGVFTVAEAKAAQAIMNVRSTGVFNSTINFYSSTSTLEANIATVAGSGILILAANGVRIPNVAGIGAPGCVLADVSGSLTVGVLCTNLANLTGTLQQPLLHLDTNINRVADRLFVGAAIVNNGPAAFPGTDWCSQLYLQSYNGGPGIQCDTSYAQMAVLYDSSSNAAATAIPQSALVVACQTLNSPVGSSCRGFETTAVNNSPLGLTVWGGYIEAHRVVPGAGQTYGFELQVRNSVAAVTGWTPYTTPGVGTIGGQFGCGAGLSATGQFPCTMAVYIGANPMPFGAGIIFADGGIGPYGPGTTKTAISFAYDHEIQWFTGGSTLGAHITSASNGNLYLKTINTVIVEGAFSLTLPNAATTRAVCYNIGNGTLSYNSTVGTCTVSSLAAKDLKERLSPEEGFAMVMAMEPWTYTMKKGLPTYQPGEEIGFVADYALRTDPRLVAINPDGSAAGFRYEQYTAALTAAFKHDSARISQLEKSNEALHAENDNLVTRIKQIEARGK